MTYLSVSKYMNKCNLFCLHNVTYMCIFAPDCSSLYNKLLYFFMWKITSPLQLPGVLCVGLKFWGIIPVNLIMSIVVTFVQFTFGQYIVRFSGCGFSYYYEAQSLLITTSLTIPLHTHIGITSKHLGN